MKRGKRKQKTKQGISPARTLAYRWIREKIIKILEGSGYEWSSNFNKYEHVPDFENTSREDRNPIFFPDQTKPFKKIIIIITNKSQYFCFENHNKSEYNIIDI